MKTSVRDYPEASSPSLVVELGAQELAELIAGSNHFQRHSQRATAPCSHVILGPAGCGKSNVICELVRQVWCGGSLLV